MSDVSRREFSRADGLRLVADVGGPRDGPLVVLLHGGGQTRHSWSGAMLALIAQGYRVVNFDAMGHGESDWSPGGDYSLGSRAGDLVTVIGGDVIGGDVIGGDRGPVALVGASMGGMTSFYAVGSGHLPGARALVMVDIVLRPAAEGIAKIHAFMLDHVGGFASIEEVADAVAAYNPDRPRPADPGGLHKNVRLRDDGRLYWHWDPRMLEEEPSAEPPVWTDQLLEVSNGIAIPTLLVRGGHSDIVDDAGVAEMRQLVPQTEIYDVAGAGHMVAGDKNDAFNTGVIQFLHRHMPA